MMDDIRARAREIAVNTQTDDRVHADDDAAAPAAADGEVQARDRTGRDSRSASSRRGCRAAPATTRR